MGGKQPPKLPTGSPRPSQQSNPHLQVKGHSSHTGTDRRSILDDPSTLANASEVQC
jgi:hypothetical protein